MIKDREHHILFWLLLSFCIAGFLYRGVLVPLFYPPYPSNDFRGVFYPTVKTLLGEGNLYTDAYGYFYPPFSALVIAPFTYLAVRWAEKAWFLILLVSVSATFFFLGTAFSKRPPFFCVLLLFVFSQFEPLYVDLSYYQIDLLILLILVVAFRLEEKGYPFWAGVFLALGAMIKITPLFFIFYFLVRKKWKSIFGFLCGAAMFGILTTLGVGVKGWSDFFLVGIPRLMEGSAGNALDHSFTNILLRLQEIVGGGGMQKSSPWIRVGSISFATGVIILLWHFLKNSKHHSLGLEYSAVICAMLLSATTMNETHLVLLLFPFSILVSLLFQHPEPNPRLIFLVGLAFAIVGLRYGYTVPFLRETLWGLPLAKAKFFGTCLTYFCCLSLLREKGYKTTRKAHPGNGKDQNCHFW